MLSEVIEGAQPELNGFASLYFLLSRKPNQGTSSLKPSTQYSQDSWTNKRVGKETLPHHNCLRGNHNALLMFTNLHF